MSAPTSGLAERTLPLSQGKVALVDAEDYERVAGVKWHAVQNCLCWYAQRNVRNPTKRTTVSLHKAIFGSPPGPGLQIDHINGDGLDNRRANLRWVTPSQNGMNRRNRRAKRGSSQYRGVVRTRGRWEARLVLNGEQMYLGRFSIEEDAARAWDAAAEASYGEFGALNFPAARADAEPEQA